MIPWPCVHEFLAIVTNTRIFPVPTPQDQALRQLELWIGSPSLELGAETVRHWSTLRRLVRQGRVTGGMVHDARVAAICIDHAVEVLWTADRDFARFPQLATANPLVDVGRG